MNNPIPGAEGLVGKLAFEYARDFATQSNSLVYGIFALAFAFYGACLATPSARTFAARNWHWISAGGATGTAAWSIFLYRAGLREWQLVCAALYEAAAGACKMVAAESTNPLADSVLAAVDQQSNMRILLIAINAVGFVAFVCFLRFRARVRA